MPQFYRIKRTLRKVENKLFGNLMVLMYHRVTDILIDPFSTCVTPNNFQEHLEVLKSLGKVFPGQKIHENNQRHLCGGYKFVLTFDDGYQDNFDNALPLLHQHRFPATFFIVEKSDQHFPAYYWDVLQGIFLEKEHLPAEFQVLLVNKIIPIDLGADAVFPRKKLLQDSQWKIGRSNFPSRRHYWLKFFIYEFKSLSTPDREACLENLAHATDCEELLHKDRTASWELLKQIVRDENVEIGSHSISHRQLSSLSLDEQAYEISESKKRLEVCLGEEVHSFSIPHGGPNDFSESTISCIKEAGYQQAYIYGERPLNYRYDPYRIPRINIGDWDGDTFRHYMLKILNKTN
jgi:peptidoglycan/xylan/chitin deacetylase (PgdA/CDA1 family)